MAYYKAPKGPPMGMQPPGGPPPPPPLRPRAGVASGPIPRLTRRVEKLLTLRRAALVVSPSQKANDEGPSCDAPADATNVSDTYQQNTEIERERQVVAEVRYYNLAGFVNRKDVVGGGFVIEALMTTVDWASEVDEEQRRYSTKQGNPTWDNIESIPGAVISSGVEAFGDDMRLGAVRIQSSTIINAFLEFAGSAKSRKSSALFPRPFVTFRETYQQMKIKLIEMESAAVDCQSPGHSFLDLDHQESGNPRTNCSEVDEVHYMGSRQITERSLQEMRCYIQFVETVILPIWSSFSLRETPGPKTVEYEDLPCLFKEGDLIYVPEGGAHQLHQSAFQSVWRLRHFRPANSYYAGECLLYCLDYNGDSIVPVYNYVDFRYFPGAKEITALPCYPLSFHENSAAILEETQDLGSRFLFCTRKHPRGLFYSGWTLVTGRGGEFLRNEEGRSVAGADYTESEIIVDFKEALGNYPQWNQPPYYTYNPTLAGHVVEEDIVVWDSDSDSDSDSDDEPDYDAKQERELLEWERRLCLRRGQKLYEKHSLFKRGSRGMGMDEIANDDLALLPKRIYAYVLRERRFIRLDTRGVDLNYHPRRATLDDIQMKKGYQKVIRSSVEAHLKAQAKEKRGEGSTMDVDIISGKGKGLVILLHGAPGVGKTATAEAVALENNRPLFPISCGDLGFSPKIVEKTLRDIFRYAHLWECILLLDEADIFLTQRERGGDNLERNAIVGVFLRTLEYYSGILFLTTNRVGALDEAFCSRVHISLWYPHLSLPDTIKILRANLERLPRWDNTKDSTQGLIKVMDEDIEGFICREYENYSRAVQKERGPWNGRQIRNAVQIAASLALYDKESSEDEGLPAILTAGHFRTVAETMKEFDSFPEMDKAGDDEYSARRRQERADDPPLPSDNAAAHPRHRRPSRSRHSEDQYDFVEESIDDDPQPHQRRHGEAAISRRLGEEYGTIIDKGRQRGALNAAEYYHDSQSEGEEEEEEEGEERISRPYRSRGGEASRLARRIRRQEQKYSVVPTERRRRGDEHDRY